MFLCAPWFPLCPGGHAPHAALTRTSVGLDCSKCTQVRAKRTLLNLELLGLGQAPLQQVFLWGGAVQCLRSTEYGRVQELLHEALVSAAPNGDAVS